MGQMLRMKKRGKTARRFFFAALAAGALAAESAFFKGGPSETSATPGTPSMENASSLPDPGDDWILRKKSETRSEASGNDEANGDLPSGNAKTSESFAALADVAAVGKIVAIDSTGIETEDRRRDRRERTPKRLGDAILLSPPVDPSAAEAFCVEIREAPGARDRDRFWLRNGDEFDGELLRVDRRRVWIRAFDVEFAVPRGRVRAVRFAEIDEDAGDGKLGEDGKARGSEKNGENGETGRN
ncbi:MAG: hypothetical protein IJ991_14760 [Thermoguttaceae bacterium]|nr:hypothetical protein [Thermoguttaceae bacterium]